VGALWAVKTAFGDAPSIRPIALLLAAVTFFFAILIGSFLVTGYVELVTGMPVVSASGAVLVVVLFFFVLMAVSKTSRSHPFEFLREAYGQFNAAGRSGLAAIAKAEPRLLVMSGVLLVGAIALSTFIMGYPRGTESLAYHLPNGLTALQTGSLRIPDAAFYSALPANDSIWYAFLLTFLPERFVALGQLPFLPILVLAIYGIARKAGADARSAAIASIGILSIPVIMLHAILPESDVAGLTFLAIAIYFIVCAELPAARYVVAGLGVGLAFGFKSLYLQAGGLLALATIAEPWWRPAGEGLARQRSQWLRGVGAFLAAATMMASFWVIRNYLQTGNPLYPIYIGHLFDVLGWPPAKDVDYDEVRVAQFFWVRSTWEWAIYPWIEWHYADAGTYYKANAGMGAFFAAAVPVAWLFTAGQSLVLGQQRASDDQLKIRMLLLLGGTLLLIAWFVLGGRDPHYATAAWAFVLPLVGSTIAVVRGRARSLLEALLTICILWMFFSFLSQEIITFGDRIVYSRHFSRDKYYEYPAVVDGLPEGAVIVNLAQREANYPLVGSKHQNRVIKFESALRTFGIDAKAKGYKLSLENDAKGIVLDTETLRKLGATHVYTQTKAEVKHDACIRLRELDRLERNPVSGAKLDPPKMLYQIDYCSTALAKEPS